MKAPVAKIEHYYKPEDPSAGVRTYYYFRGGPVHVVNTIKEGVVHYHVSLTRLQAKADINKMVEKLGYRQMACYSEDRKDGE